MFLFIAVIFLSLQSVSAADRYCLANADSTGNTCVALLAGQHMDAGTVCSKIDGENLLVTVTTREEWTLDILHSYISRDLEGYPQSRQGNPIPGQFPYKAIPSSPNTHTVTVPMSTLDPTTICNPTNNQIFMGIHAGVSRVLADESIDSQTAWGEGVRFVEKGNWATWFAAQVLCNEDCGSVEPPVKDQCDTAFAKSDFATCFLDLTIDKFNRWGWTNGPLVPTAGSTYAWTVWAGAGQCDTSKGHKVGTVSLRFVNETQAQVNINTLSANWAMSGTHVYIGATQAPVFGKGYTVAPGQYTAVHNFDEIKPYTDSFVINFTANPVYVIVHASGCM